MTSPALLAQLRELEQHVAHDRHGAALALCRALIDAPLPSSLYAVLSQNAQRLGDFEAMLAAAQKSAAGKPDDFPPRLRLAECYLYAGHTERCLAELQQLAHDARHDPGTLQLTGNLYVHCAAHARALGCFERAAELRPAHVPYLYNVATSCVALGDLDRAETLFNTVIALMPSDFGACVNRAMLRTWDSRHNHIGELQRLLSGTPDGHPGQVPLCYALAKEYEDTGDSAAAFTHLQLGAEVRRKHLAYRVENEVATMDAIQQAFSPEVLAGAGVVPGANESAPWFVLGLPRSGTTLVERILSSHLRIGSVGEVNNLAFAVMEMARGPGGKPGMIARAAHGDFGALRARYLRGIGGYGIGKPQLINKTPENFLYLGIIHLALPDAKVVHLRRHPLDSCFAMYKTLFRMGYPYSYSLQDLGHYYLAYHRLMAHWRATIPGRCLDVDYETLVAQQEAVSRSMLAHGGLEWEAACLDFHENATPSATASAVQVRRPVYSSSVARWRRYEQQLRPLAAFLESHGIDCS
jgi:tetratricopeptide (TPR) repeat protein